VVLAGRRKSLQIVSRRATTFLVLLDSRTERDPLAGQKQFRSLRERYFKYTDTRDAMTMATRRI
jgi:hypothetical protein